MDVSYDFFNLIESPYIVLCNPNQNQLFSLGNITNTKLSLKYNTLSEFSFELVQILQNSTGANVVDPAYALLKAKRLVLIEDFGYFQIATVTENREGDIPIKTVECTSWESELIHKQINSFTAETIKLYDPIDNSETFIGRILEGTNWDIGDVTSDLWNIYRDFDVSSSNVYNILMTTAETAYNCIFTFNPFERLVNITSIENATTDTDIFLSFDNLISKTSFKEISDEIVTAMEVYGGDGLDIRSVNPLGTNTIYNFEYYQQRDTNDVLLWMSEGLNTALYTWYDKIYSKMDIYSSYLVKLKTQNGVLLTLQGELVDLESEMAALVEVKKAKIEQGLDLTDINNEIDEKQGEIDDKNVVINTTKAGITVITNQLIIINQYLSLTNTVNFTLAQQAELRPLIIENNYQNDNIIMTELMTPVEVQDQANELYYQAVDVLRRQSQPRYEFTVEAANFVALKEYSIFTQQLDLAKNVTIEVTPGIYVITSLLEINLSFDKLDDFSLVFSNRLRLDNGSFVSSDLMNRFQGATNTVISESGVWGGYNNNKNNILTTTSILNAATNEIRNSNNQEITIGAYGLQGKKKLLNGNFSGDMVWLTSSTLAFSKDSFQTSGLALGRIQLPGGGTAFGLAADAIFGTILAGNQLRISNSGGNLVLDQNGCVLTNSTFTITSNATNPNTIILSPTQGILIKNKVGTNVFSVDGGGNITFKGLLSGATGSFSGSITASSGFISQLVINSTGLQTVNGLNYLRNDGSMKWGGFQVDSSGNSIFSGSVSAQNITGRINGNTQIQSNSIPSANIQSLIAEKISAGVMTAVDIFGGTLSSGNTYADPAVKIYGDDYFATISGSGGVVITGSDVGIGTPSGHIETQIFMNGNAISISCPMDSEGGDGVGGLVQIGQINNSIAMLGSVLNIVDVGAINTSGGLGVNGTYQIQITNVGNRLFKFVNGILVKVSTT